MKNDNKISVSAGFSLKDITHLKDAAIIMNKIIGHVIMKALLYLNNILGV
ncbi:MAG: hypothetical protein ABIL66_03775 [candidate division WOR-3 bacterium]